jgi:hypothetical protein
VAAAAGVFSPCSLCCSLTLDTAALLLSGCCLQVEKASLQRQLAEAEAARARLDFDGMVKEARETVEHQPVPNLTQRNIEFEFANVFFNLFVAT